MIKIHRLLLASILCVSFGCQSYSGEKHEHGKVSQVSFLPGGVATGYNFGKGGGFTATRIPDRYVVVIECDQHKFIVENEQAKELFNCLKVGDSVDVTYQNIIKDDRVIGRKFVDAAKIVRSESIAEPDNVLNPTMPTSTANPQGMLYQ